MSAWFDNFMTSSQEEVYDVMHVFDFLLFEDNRNKLTVEERREVLENGLAHLDALAAANFPTWEMYVGDNRYDYFPAEPALARWREQMETALNENKWHEMLHDAIVNGPFLVVFGKHHPLRSTTSTS